MFRLALIAFVALFVAATPALAQYEADMFGAQIAMLNRTPAVRNPDFKTWDQMFTMRILDMNRQLVGNLADLSVDETGAVVELVSDITWVGAEEKTVKNAIGETTFIENKSAFQIPLRFEAPAYAASPESLAAIAPAAGGGKILSLKAMKGAQVLSMQGRRVGVVTNVLLDDQAQSVKALVLQEVRGGERYNDVAIPFDPQVLSVEDHYGRIEFRLTAAAAKAVTEYAEHNR